MQHLEWKQALLFIVWAIKPGRKKINMLVQLSFQLQITNFNPYGFSRLQNILLIVLKILI